MLSSSVPPMRFDAENVPLAGLREAVDAAADVRRCRRCSPRRCRTRARPSGRSAGRPMESDGQVVRDRLPVAAAGRRAPDAAVGAACVDDAVLADRERGDAARDEARAAARVRVVVAVVGVVGVVGDARDLVPAAGGRAQALQAGECRRVRTRGDDARRGARVVPLLLCREEIRGLTAAAAVRDAALRRALELLAPELDRDADLRGGRMRAVRRDEPGEHRREHRDRGGEHQRRPAVPELRQARLARGRRFRQDDEALLEAVDDLLVQAAASARGCVVETHTKLLRHTEEKAIDALPGHARRHRRRLIEEPQPADITRDSAQRGGPPCGGPPGCSRSPERR